MIPSELDQWRVAQQLLNQYGLDAEDQALDRVERALDREARTYGWGSFTRFRSCDPALPL